jgi:hypothetical protein
MIKMDAAELERFSAGYAAAWCSRIAASVAAFYEMDGSLQINAGPPAVGRNAIETAAQSFVTSFPDMIVSMDGVSMREDHAIFRWTLVGTNTGPHGTGRTVRISGYEQWTFGLDGLIKESKGHFDETDYLRQLDAPDAPNSAAKR